MFNIRKEVVNSTYNRAYSLIIYDDIHSWRWITYKRWKNRVIKRFDGDYDYFKVVEMTE